ncbi:MAG: glycosyl hydrolase [Victivallaceae bacterium]|nr:glycosyl hydrolase [Victivallaceae bacterium]
MNDKVYVTGQYFLNHDLDADEVRKQVREIAQAGYQAIYGHARQGLETPYFSEEWWQIIRVIVDECRANGMRFAIWDEDYFPSATAGNRIIWSYPELAAQNLNFTVAEFMAADSIIKLNLLDSALLKCYALPKLDSGFGEPIDISAHCGTIRTQWTARRVQESAYSNSRKIKMPHWRTSMGEESKTYAVKWYPEIQQDYVIIAIQIAGTNGRHNTDILNEKTTAKFIDYTHQEYAKRFGAKVLTENFHATFMDEPAPGGIFPWTGRFAEEFVAEHGYDIIPNLPHLALDIDEKTPLVRHHYRMTQMRLQCSNYLEQVQKWCHEHNIQSVGHLTRSEWLAYVAHAWPNELRCYKYLDIPCTDPLGAGIAWRDAAAYHVGLKVVSSAAHIFGKAQSGSDALAVMGNETSIRDLKFSLDYQMVMGINYFNLHGLSYSFDGPRKDEVPPSLFYQHSEWQYMPALIEYTKKTCEALSAGEHLCGIGMLYPSTSFYCKLNAQKSWDASELGELEEKIHLLADDLLSNQKDFDLIDEITLTECPSGKMPENWQVIIVPFLKFITNETAFALEKFKLAGGRVIIIGEIPQLLGDTLDEPLIGWENHNLDFCDALTPEIILSLPGPELKGAGKENIFVLRRIDGERIINFLFNRAENQFVGCLDGKPVNIAPKGSLLFDNKTITETVVKTIGETDLLNTGWQVEFSENHIPLIMWQANNGSESPSYEYNLLERQQNPVTTGNGKVFYKSRFMYSGEIKPLKIVLDRSAVKGDWQLFLNDFKINNFKNERVYDCYNVSADLTNCIRSNSIPTENIITIVTEGDEGGLLEMPYLYGDFACEYRHAYRSLPFLQSEDGLIELNTFPAWKELGYPAFSGTAEYSIELNIIATGEYVINLGRIEDIAEVFIDGNHIALLAWPPYECKLGFLRKGNYTLTVKVANGPGNRDRLAMLSSGLLGPVRLWQINS